MVDEWGSIITRSRWLDDATRNALAGRHSLSQSSLDASVPAPCWATPPSQWAVTIPFFEGFTDHLVRDIRKMCNQEWRVSFHHMSRISNRVADSLVKLVSSSSFDVLHFAAPPLAIVHLLREDVLFPSA
ncbi:hypothetical protein V6N11_080162 [Hibiscus sabdariffa]|uniref:Uncharacterized protein n=2 Tax=Hibiscus sabdariffa TaxID=183260 RepID=A0ABR2C0L7_9ROSI